MNENQSILYQNLRDTTKQVLAGKFVALCANIKKEKCLKDLMHFEDWENQEQTKCKISKMQEITRLRAEINNIETRKKRQKIRKPKSGFWEDQQNRQIIRWTKKKKKRDEKKLLHLTA